MNYYNVFEAAAKINKCVTVIRKHIKIGNIKLSKYEQPNNRLKQFISENELNRFKRKFMSKESNDEKFSFMLPSYVKQMIIKQAQKNKCSMGEYCVNLIKNDNI